MTAQTIAKPLLSGYCGYGNPRQHELCRGNNADRRLRCSCHRVELLDLPDALQQLCRATCGAAANCGAHDPICQTFHHLHSADTA